MVIRRGEIWIADLGIPQGSEPGYQRPILVIQDNYFNDSHLATIIVLGITSNTRHSKYPGNVFLSRKESNLSKDSVVNVTQIATIDKQLLVERVSALPERLIDQVDYGLGLSLGLRA